MRPQRYTNFDVWRAAATGYGYKVVLKTRGKTNLHYKALWVSENRVMGFFNTGLRSGSLTFISQRSSRR